MLTHPTLDGCNLQAQNTESLELAQAITSYWIASNDRIQVSVRMQARAMLPYIVCFLLMYVAILLVTANLIKTSN